MWLAGLAALAVILGLAGPAGAQQTRTFLGVKISPLSGTYIVTKDVRVRSKPKTGSNQIGRLKKGVRVEVVGKPKGKSWLAVRQDDKDFGFVFAPILLPLLNGKLEKDIKGKILGRNRPTCDYTIHFEGKSPLEGELFEVSDYEAVFKCKTRKGKAFAFRGPMFLIEAPYDSSKRQKFQISIDLLELSNGYDEVFSTTFFYHRDKNKVVYDSVSQKEYAADPKMKEKPVRNIREALDGAVQLALVAWNDKLWDVFLNPKPDVPEAKP